MEKVQATAAPEIRVEVEKIPETLAMRLGAAVYNATLEWLESQQKGKSDEQQAL